ncbi:peroxidase family protein [Microbacterium rhizosphaerae]|uniref:Heme peroxidase family protein n=1 Tax=Microbacterium rhizosphaerae TaxID=1678237 RepID=A0ABZ0SP62_9MICO|nr:heme peroxidase family protein [Microbacterium rhizosphaerae]WPR90580.1 heme peroxidase family protein [Microbacterium rhizosphaerae]
MTRHGSYTVDIVPPRSKYYDSGRFGRMFGSLPPFAADTPEIRAALLDIGKPGGIMDAQDDLAAGPVQLIVDPALSQHNRNSTTHVAGDTFLGQFIDHDITFDPTSSLSRAVDPEQISNFRTPSLGLDNIYGSGPNISPHLYDQHSGGIAMLLEETGTPGKNDVPRNSQGVALIGDPRDDENLIVSQLQTGMLRFHNAVLDHVRSDLGITNPGEAFTEAQRIVRWHYQWIVVHHFLTKTCGDDVVTDVLTNGRRFYSWNNEPFIPVEFSVAAYRFGHSQIRPSYRANFTGNPGGTPFFGMIFTADSLPGGDPDDLSGGCRAPRRFVDWPTFFDFGDGNVRPNKKIDTTLSTALFTLPGSVVARPDAKTNPASLAQRNLLRHLTFSLPSGQRVARAMNAPELRGSDLADLQQYGLDDRTPLWFYVLREADVAGDGERLGPVGGRIVAEVMLGLIEGDSTSYLAQDPDWQPFLPTIDPTRQHTDFQMIDLLRFAGVA